MANVSVKLDIKYHVTRKDGNKEVGQKVVKQSLYFPVITEAQFTSMREFIEAVTEVTELIPE
jgi:hypothetical protein